MDSQIAGLKCTRNAGRNGNSKKVQKVPTVMVLTVGPHFVCDVAKEI